jgi:hypothetical protein
VSCADRDSCDLWHRGSECQRRAVALQSSRSSTTRTGSRRWSPAGVLATRLRRLLFARSKACSGAPVAQIADVVRGALIDLHASPGPIPFHCAAVRSCSRPSGRPGFGIHARVSRMVARFEGEVLLAALARRAEAKRAGRASVCASKPKHRAARLARLPVRIGRPGDPCREARGGVVVPVSGARDELVDEVVGGLGFTRFYTGRVRCAGRAGSSGGSGTRRGVFLRGAPTTASGPSAGCAAPGL